MSADWFDDDEFEPWEEPEVWRAPDFGDVRSVLAYGTLRPGEGNHHWTVGHLAHEAHRGTLHGWRLTGANFGFPFALPGSPDDAIIGDVLTFSADDWPEARGSMDRLEGVPHLYRPSLVTVALDSGPDVTALIYVPVDTERAEALAPVPGGDWCGGWRTRPANRKATR